MIAKKNCIECRKRISIIQSKTGESILEEAGAQSYSHLLRCDFTLALAFALYHTQVNMTSYLTFLQEKHNSQNDLHNAKICTAQMAFCYLEVC